MSEKELITVAIIDNDKDFLENSLALLRKENDIEVCASHLLTNILKETVAANEAGKDIYRCKPTVLLICQEILREVAAMDLKTVFKMRDASPQIQTVVTVDHCTEEAVMILIREGTRGIYMRELGPSQIVLCVRTVARGEIWLEASMIGRIIGEFSKLYKHVESLQPPTKSHEARLSLLSPREMEVLGLISKSYTNEDIGKTLFISEKPVKTHNKNIFEKLEPSCPKPFEDIQNPHADASAQIIMKIDRCHDLPCKSIFRGKRLGINSIFNSTFVMKIVLILVSSKME